MRVRTGHPKTLMLPDLPADQCQGITESRLRLAVPGGAPDWQLAAAGVGEAQLGQVIAIQGQRLAQR